MLWAVFRKSDKRVVGASADSPEEVEKATALEEVVRGLVGSPDPADFDAVQVVDPEQIPSLLVAIGTGQAVVRSRGDELEVEDDTPEVYSLAVTTDAEETHPVDGVPLIPGDGTSYLTVNLQKVNAQGEPLARKKDNETFWLRADHGTLRDAEGTKEVRSVKLASGKAAFRIYSEAAKRLATVTIFNEDPNLRDTAVRVEFI